LFFLIVKHEFRQYILISKYVYSFSFLLEFYRFIKGKAKNCGEIKREVIEKPL
jgi:hypothetical protein